MSLTLDDYRTSVYKVPGNEPLAARKELIRAYCKEHQRHYIVVSYLHTAASMFTIFKLEAVDRNGTGYPLEQDHTVPELHIEFDPLDPTEKQELFDALPVSRKKHR